MKINKIIPVLMCGGSGTRLWPLSRKNYPKQFVLKNRDGLTLFQSTLLQFKDSKFYNPLIITNQEYRFIVREQAKEIKIKLEAVILEPVSKNTFATVIAACLYLNEKHPNTRAIFSPTDHLVDSKKFISCIFKNKKTSDMTLCLIGTKPKFPDINLGYIKCSSRSNGIYNITKFIEKPKLYKAKNLIEDNNVYWNTGNFIINPGNILHLAQSLEVKAYTAISKAHLHSYIDLDFIRLNDNYWNSIKKISFDYALVEKTKDRYMIAYTGPWSDLGTLKSFYSSQQKDNKKNYTHGNVFLSETSNSLVMSDSDLTTATHNVDDIAVITEKDTVFVTKLSESSNLSGFIASLSKTFPSITDNKSQIHKPWGSYTNIYEGSNFKVKLLSVKPNESLSYQSHKYRHEHWVVVTGTASIILNDKKIDLKKNESIYIPSKSKHQLMNNKKKLLQLIEVQIGSYLGEDDINRFHDKYSRKNSE